MLDYVLGLATFTAMCHTTLFLPCFVWGLILLMCGWEDEGEGEALRKGGGEDRCVCVCLCVCVCVCGREGLAELNRQLRVFSVDQPMGSQGFNCFLIPNFVLIPLKLDRCWFALR